MQSRLEDSPCDIGTRGGRPESLDISRLKTLFRYSEFLFATAYVLLYRSAGCEGDEAGLNVVKNIRTIRGAGKMKPYSWLTGAVFCIAATTASAQEVTLKISHFLPAVSNFQRNVLEPWCDKINKASNGRLKCQIYPSMQLGGTPPQLIDQLTNGVADIIWTVPGYAAGRFPTIDTIGVPYSVPAGGLN